MKLKELKEKLAGYVKTCKDIVDLCEKESRGKSDDEKVKFQEAFEKAEELKREVEAAEKEQSQNAEIAKMAGMTITGEGTQGKFTEGDKVDIRKFKVTKGLSKIAKGKPLDGVEKEVNTMAEDEATKSGISLEGELNLPSSLYAVGQKDYEAKVKDLTLATEAGDVRPTEFGELIPILRSDPVLASLGARVLTGLSGNMQWPRQDGAGTFAWEGETDANAETTQTLDNLSMTPNRVGGFTDISQQLIIQASFGAEQFVTEDLRVGLDIEIDSKGIDGSGASNEPTGIINTSGIGNADIGTNGGALTYAKTLELMQDVHAANGMSGSLAFLTTPEVLYQELMQVPKQASGVEGNFIYNGEGPMFGHPLAVSNQVPKDRTKGTGTALHVALFGDFSQVILGFWGGVSLLIDPYTQATNGLLRVVINAYADVGVRLPAKLSAIEDIDVS